MRRLAVVAAVGLCLWTAGCSRAPERRPDDFPALPGDPGASAATTPAAATTPVAPSGGTVADPACIRPGTYTLAYDFARASFEARQMSDEYCRAQGEYMPNLLGELVIAYPDGALAVMWPERREVKDQGRCSFTLGDVAPTIMSFVDGAGTGTMGFSFGADNHPDELCTVTNVRVTATPK